MSYTALEKYREATRELMMRQKVYPAWIKDGRISREEAERRVDIMREIATDYDRQAAGERLPGIN